MLMEEEVDVCREENGKKERSNEKKREKKQEAKHETRIIPKRKDNISSKSTFIIFVVC